MSSISATDTAARALNTRLNAVTDWADNNDNDASAAAGNQAAIAQPLAGLSVAIKANIAVKNMPFTAGMEAYRHRIAQADAKVVADLRQAGAKIIGMVNMDEAALGAKTDNIWFGKTQNPHRLGYTPGGSSGGSGAAVAAGLCDVALGTDTMGSVRIPAAYCGIYGFKPANAAVSQQGLELAEPSLDVIGPLARSIDMLERIARAMGCFAGDNHRDNAPGLLADLGGVGCSDAVLACYDSAKSAQNCTHSLRLTHGLSRIRFAGFIKTSRYMASHFSALPSDALSPQLQRLLTYGPARSDGDWAMDQKILHETRHQIRAGVAQHGAILLPTAPQTAFPHDNDAPANQADFTCLANIAGLPAISIPAGWSSAGLPIGMQLIGQENDEAALFACARDLDAHLSAYRPPSLFLDYANARKPCP